MIKKITVVGIGYVGLSLSVLLSERLNVSAVDIDINKVNLVNDRISPLNDTEIKQYMINRDLNLSATIDLQEGIENSDLVVISTPTNYDEESKVFDTSSIENILKQLRDLNSSLPVVIKSTIPVGYTNSIQKEFPNNEIFFSPEFLREGKALYDNLYPSRIIVGSSSEIAKEFASILRKSSLKKDVEVLQISSTEAEAVKLFSNSYLALRVSYFNEMDTYCEVNGISSKNVIDGVSLDPRIGNNYNNPSFGYGGYCLPKDTKQLVANFQGIPNELVSAIVSSNATRKRFIASQILNNKPKVVGVFRLIMKSGSDNFRSSSIRDIMQLIADSNVKIIIFEPTISKTTFDGFTIVNDLDSFKKQSDIIIANRKSSLIKDVEYKTYSRDLYEQD